MRGRWNGGYIGPQQTPTAGSVRGIFNAAEMQQLSGASLWPQPANDPYFQYVTALLQGNGGPPTSVSSTNTTNFNADASTNNFLLGLNGDVRNDEFHPYQEGFYSNFFDGTGDYLTISDNAAFEMTGDFTIECWFYATSAAANYSAIISKAATGIYSPYTIYLRSSLAVEFWSSTNGSSWNLASGVSFGTVTLGTWNHVAISRQGSNCRLFLNGALASTISNSTALTDNANAVGIGGRSDGTELFTGYISNVRIIKGQAIYTAAFTPSTTPLTTTSQGATASNVSLLTCQSNRIIDNGRGASITRNGDVSVQYFQPFGQSAISSATFTNNQPSPGTNGYYGVYFDGTGDYLDVTNNAVLNLAGSSYTIECWLYPTTTGTERRFINKNPASTFGYLFYLDASNVVMFRTDSTNMTAGTLTAPPNNWTHVAVTNDGTTTRIFVNGVLSTSATGVTISNENVNLRIGARLFDGSNPYTGYISNVRIIKGTALYTSNFTPDTTPLTAIANTSLLTCQSSSIIDNSGNNLTITAAGNAAVTVTQPFTSTVAGSTVVTYGSAYFDGTGDWLTVADNVNLQLGTGDFTVEFWAMITGGATNVFRALVSKGGSSTGWSVMISNTNVWGFSDTVTNTLSSTAPVYNSWTHVVFRRAGTSAVLYINGVQVASATVSTNFNQTEQLVIGAGRALDIPFTGYISGLRIVKGTSLYNAPFIPPNMPPTAISGTQLLSLQSNGGASNSGFEDSGPFDFLITRNGNVAQGAFTPYGTNWSNYFDGSGDWISAPNINFSTNNFTIEGWFYYTGVTIGSGTNTNLWGMSNGAGANPKLMAFLTTTNIYLFDNSEIINVAHGMVPNTWYHLAFVRTGTSANQCFIYRNGVAINSTSLALGTQSSVTAVFNVGYVGESYGTPFTGYISNFRVVNGTALYTSNFTPPTAPLTAIANTSLLTCQSNRLIDTSSNNFTITRNGDISVQRFSPFRPTQAYNTATYSGSAYFDGTGDYLTLPVNQSALALGSSDFTFEAWVYRTSGTGTASIFAGQSDLNTAGGSAYVFYVSSTATTDLYVGGTGYGITSPNPALGQWAHVAYARTGGTFSSYLNGVRVGTRSDLGSSSVNVGNQANPAAIGGFSNASSLLTGYITDARLIKGSGGYNATSSTLTIPAAPLASTTNTSLLLNMANTGQYDNAMMVNWESAGNTQSTPSQKKYGAASLYFDGTNDYLTTYNPSYTLSLGSGDFTFECWLYVNSLPSVVTALYHLKNDAALASSVFVLEISPSGALSLSTGSALIASGTNGKITTGSWIHVAFVRTSGFFKTFFNGIQDISVSNTTTYNGTYVQIGAWRFSSYDYSLNGYIDDLRITKGVARYTANFTPPATQFVNT